MEIEFFYFTLVKLINDINIKDALELLKQCKESDFNSINVNNYASLSVILSNAPSK